MGRTTIITYDSYYLWQTIDAKPWFDMVQRNSSQEMHLNLPFTLGYLKKALYK